MNGKLLVYLKNRTFEDSTVVFIEISLIIMQLRPKTSFYGINEMTSNMTGPKRLVYE